MATALSLSRLTQFSPLEQNSGLRVPPCRQSPRGASSIKGLYSGKLRSSRRCWLAHRLGGCSASQAMPNVRVVEVDVDTQGLRRGTCTCRRSGLGLEYPVVRYGEAGHSAASENFEELMSSLRHHAPETTPGRFTGTTTTGSPPGPSGKPRFTATRMCSLMNGGRKKWLAEGRELTTDSADPAPTAYELSPPNPLTFPCGRFFRKLQAASYGRNRLRDGGRAEPAGVHRRDPGAPRIARDLTARRPHSGRAQHSVGQSL